MVRLPVVFDTYKARGYVQHEGWLPVELLDIDLRQRLEANALAGGADRAARIESFQSKILDMLESRRDSTRRIDVHLESDQTASLSEGPSGNFLQCQRQRRLMAK